tara:strand:- start:75 stop:326 length:252 start_codon:yes stop_codon:yes gene_type:complete
MTRTKELLELVSLLHKASELASGMTTHYEELESYTGAEGDEDSPKWEAGQEMLESLESIRYLDETAGELETILAKITEAEEAE